MDRVFNQGGNCYPVWKCKKGYACVAVNVDGRSRAFLLHKIVWEEVYGPVPAGYEIHHLDHDRMNWRLDNLIAVDRQTHLALHRQTRPTDINNKAGVIA